MRRRVLALLLTPNMTLSGNSMTLLVAEQGVEAGLDTQEDIGFET